MNRIKTEKLYTFVTFLQTFIMSVHKGNVFKRYTYNVFYSFLATDKLLVLQIEVGSFLLNSYLPAGHAGKAGIVYIGVCQCVCVCVCLSTQTLEKTADQ